MKKESLITSLVTLLIPVSTFALGVQVIVGGESITLKDVPQSAWYATYVQQAAEAGIVSGYKDSQGKLMGEFGPTNTITIAEALKIAVESAGYSEEIYGSVIDSGVNHWSAAYVSVANAEGFEVISPRTRLDSVATRAEVAALITSAFDVDTETPIGSRYDDVTFSTDYGFSVEALSRDEVLSGDTDIEGKATGTFRPTEPINRAEVAKIAMVARAKYGTPGEGQTPNGEGTTENDKRIMSYTSSGFSPQVLTIKKGQSVTFRNDSTADMWVASNDHPTHTNLSGFDALKSIGQGETYSYTFTQIGSWGFHNHAYATHGGTIVVQE